MTMASASAETKARRPMRWHIAVFLAPAVIVYSAVMIVPLYGTLQLSLLPHHRPAIASSPDSTISARCSATRAGPPVSGTRSGTTPGSSSSTWWCRTRSAWRWQHSCPARGCASRAFYRTAIFVPTILSFVIVGFVWKLILSPIWGVAPNHARPGRPEEPVHAVARQGGICADHARPDLGVAVRRHPDDADLRGAAVDPRRGRSRRPRWTASPAWRSSGRSSCR